MSTSFFFFWQTGSIFNKGLTSYNTIFVEIHYSICDENFEQWVTIIIFLTSARKT